MSEFSTPSTMIVFPTYIGAMTGVGYVRVGVRKVWVTLTDGRTLSIPRKAFPAALPEGNDLAFAAARLVADGPAEVSA